MSVFKKLFGTGESKNTQKEVKSKQIRSRNTRINILALHHIHFRRAGAPESESIQIANLSIKGIGFVKTPGLVWPKPGALIQGTLTINNENYEVTPKVARVTEQVVGCSIENSQHGLIDAIARYFKLELTAQKMTKLRKEHLNPVSEGEPHYFVGENNCDLYYVESADQLLYFYVTFFGNHIEWKPGQKLKFGMIDEGIYRDKASHKKTPTVVATSGFSGFSEEMLDSVVRYVDNINELDTPIKKKIRDSLEASFTKNPSLKPQR